MKFNEEFIKNNIVMPFISNIGFSEYELEFENTFNIQLGRGVYNVKSDQVTTASGRLDILCKIDNKNLFIIEMKAEEIEISDKDRRQALSYARLIEPMAAYAIVSNGRKTILYDTITGKEVHKVSSNIFNSDFRLELDEEISRLRFEGLKNFIGYSLNNLVAFCKMNNEIILDRFCAKDSDEFSTKTEFKYIPELYVKRKDIEDKFIEFIDQSNKKVFAVIGESGAGKTNILCHLSKKYITEPVLFFSGSFMGKVLLDEILNDFNIIFSSEESKISLLKKLSSIANIHNKEIILIIDAIDEWSAEDKVSQLNQLVKYINHLNIKICLSCKTLMWEEFKMQNGINTYTQDNIFFETPILEGFSEKEFKEAIDKYCSFYQTSISDKANLSKIQNPFNLKVACEVANIDKQSLDNCIDSIETIRKYISYKLYKISNKKLAKRYLKGISEYMLNEDKILVSEDSIRNYLKLGINDEIPEELFVFNFLYKYVDESANLNMGFYFSGVRDYLISIEILTLKTLNSQKRQEKIISVISNYIGENAIIYYFKTGNNREKEDCLKAIIQYDKNYEKNMLIKILSLKEIPLYDDIEESLMKSILNYLKYNFIIFRENKVISTNIVNIMKKVNNIENDLIEMISILLKYPNSEFRISAYDIAELLQQYNSEDGTIKLIDMALDKNNSDYIRQFIAYSLENRSIDTKKKVFINLIVDDYEGVRNFVRDWYYELEDTCLRNELLDISDNIIKEDVNIDIFMCLARSELPDTGEKLYFKLINKKYDEMTTAWLCRSIASQGYLKAIPAFIKMFNENPNGEVANHIAISFEQLQAEESAIVLLDKIKKDLDLGKESIFIDRAFASLASDEHVEELISYPIKKVTSEKLCHRLKILSRCQNHNFEDLIFDIVMDNTVNVMLRINLLSEWSTNVVFHNVRIINKDKILKYLYELFNENSEIAVLTFNVLVSVEDDINKLYMYFISVLPKIKYLFRFNWGAADSKNIYSFGKHILKWINTELMNVREHNFVYVMNLLKFCTIVGDEKSIESIYGNKEILIDITSENYIMYVEYCIRGDDDHIYEDYYDIEELLLN